MLSILEVVLNSLEVVADVATALAPETWTVTGRELFLGIGLLLAYEICAVDFSSWVLAVGGLIAPFVIVGIIRRQREDHEGLDAAFDARQAKFYTALAALLAVCILDQGVKILLLHVAPGTPLWRPLFSIGHTIYPQLAIAAAFPVILAVLWYVPKRLQAIAIALMAAGVMSSLIDQGLYLGVFGYWRIAGAPPFNLADLAVVIGAMTFMFASFRREVRPQLWTRAPIDLRRRS